MPSQTSKTSGYSPTPRPGGTLEAPINIASLSLQDALDLAILMEEEARERYEEFTRIVGGRYKGDAADMFRVMAGYEAKHGAQLAERRRKLFGEAPRRLTRDMLDDVEAPDRGKPRVFMSARQAMEVALASEEKAHDFFARALQHVSDPGVRTLFEELRAEELQHQKLVKERLDKLPPGPDVEEDEADDPGSDPGN
jgi:erythrin-vacuolar iron transport family protein